MKVESFNSSFYLFDQRLEISLFDFENSKDEMEQDSEGRAIHKKVTSTSSSDSDSDYDESMEQIHDELTCKEMVRLEILVAIKSQPNIDFGLNDEIIDDKPIDSNYPINS